MAPSAKRAGNVNQAVNRTVDSALRASRRDQVVDGDRRKNLNPLGQSGTLKGMELNPRRTATPPLGVHRTVPGTAGEERHINHSAMQHTTHNVNRMVDREATMSTQKDQKDTAQTQRAVGNARPKGMDTEAQAAMLATASKLYVELADLAATVTVESNEARIKAVRKAAEFVQTGVSLRKAAEAAGRKPDTSLDRFTTIARAISDKVIKAPAPYKTWDDAVAHSSLRSMVKHIRDTRGKKTRKDTSTEERAKRIIFANLRNLQSLTLRSKSTKRRGVIVKAESINQIVTAWLDAGMPMDKADLAKLPEPVMVSRKPTGVDAVAEGTPVGDALAAAQDAMEQGQEVQRATA